MKHSDDQIKTFLDGQGMPWESFVLAPSGLPSYRDERGQLIALIIEDDALYASVQKFLIRVGSGESNGSAAASVRAPAQEVEQPFWVRVSINGPLSTSQMQAVRSADPGGSTESAQAFVARMRATSEQRLGPFWMKAKASAAVEALVAVGLAASLEIGGRG